MAFCELVSVESSEYPYTQPGRKDSMTCRDCLCGDMAFQHWSRLGCDPLQHWHLDVRDVLV